MNPTPLSPLANHLWQSTLFAAAAWLLTLALRTNSARVRHGVWLAASCKFLIPFSVLVALGGQVHWRRDPQAARPVLYVAMDAIGQPFRSTAGTAGLPGRAAATDLLPEVLFCIWMFGFVALSVSWWARWRRIGAAVRGGSHVHLAGAQMKAISSPTLLEPGVFGVFRPVLLLPEGLCDRLTPAQLQTVIAHELCHLRHRDNLIAALHMLVETVFWFHPPVWWIGKRMVEERERACDEEVLRTGCEPRTYAEGILNVCRHYVESPLACVSGVTGSNLKRRIEGIMAGRREQRLNRPRKILLASAGVAALAGPVLFGVGNAPAIGAQSTATPAHSALKANFVPAAAQMAQPRAGFDSSKFEAASLKPSAPGGIGFSVRPAPGNERYLARNATLKILLTIAYGVRADQVLGGPSWIDNDRYDMDAKAARPSSPDQLHSMLRELLVDRFRLQFHLNSQNAPIYALIVDKGGLKVQQRSAQNDDNPWIDTAAKPEPGQPLEIKWHATASSMMYFAFRLSQILDRPVIDRTGLDARYDFDLTFSRERPEGIPSGAIFIGDPKHKSDSTIFDAVRRQLGLGLEPQKGPVEVMVIDHADRPTEN